MFLRNRLSNLLRIILQQTMQLTATKETDNDNNALLSDHDSKKKDERKWSTFQLVLISFVICVLSVIVSNLDRLIFDKDNQESDSTSPPFDPNKSFGHEMLDYFELDEEWSSMYFNWGSHGMIFYIYYVNDCNLFSNINDIRSGGIPTYVMEEAQTLYDRIATCPQCYFNLNREDELSQTLQLLAEYLGIQDWEDLVFVDNASQGINTVLQSLSSRIWGEKCTGNTTCKVLRFSTSYPMVRNAVQWFDASPLSPIPQEIVFDITLQQLTNATLLLQDLREFIEMENNGNNTIYLAFITHVLHNPAVIIDVKSITSLFREYNIITCIDGAHSMGQIKINISDMNPDIYIANGYKWFYSPRGSALMYVKKEFQYLMYPVVISTRNPFIESFQRRFIWLGLKDYVPFAMMRIALDFREKIGDDRIIDYIHNMAIQGGQRVAEIWGTRMYIDNEEYIAALVTVVLPPNNLTTWNSTKWGISKKLWLRVDFNVYGDNVARFSTQIFHELEDFEKAAYTMLEIIDDVG